MRSKRTLQIGEVYNYLTVVELTDQTTKSGKRLYLCKCVCGNTTLLDIYRIQSGSTKSCGCLQKIKAGEQWRSHGMSYTRQYTTWRNLFSRCRDPSNPYFHLYGGRGVEICDKWETFEGFWEEMSDGYSDNLTLDRIDPNKGYSKENCRWATPTAQSRNLSLSKRNNTGFIGVNYRATGDYYSSTITLEKGNCVTKNFYVKEYGSEGALLAAVAWRKEKEASLKGTPYEYGEFNGVQRKNLVEKE